MTERERPHLKIDLDGAVARVTLARPEVRNAFDDDLVRSLTEAATALGADDRVRAVVLAGEGKVFCAGADLRWMQRMVDYGEAENRADSEALARMFEAWDDLPRPVVGRIQGAAIGGGTGLVAVCDVAVAAGDAVFAFSEVRLGILPAVISPFVMRKIGPGAARDLFLTGDRFDAVRAREIGLVQRTVPAADLDAEVDAVVASLAAGGPAAQTRIKRLVSEIAGHPPSRSRELTAAAIAAARVSPEGQEGMRAFLERRSPAWKKES